MKKVVSTLTALSLGLSLVFTGCSKDDESEKTDNNYAGIIAGTYAGNLSMAGSEIVPSATISVTRVSDDKVTLTMDETLVGLPVVGDLPLNVSCEAEVSKTGDAYKISGNTTVSIPQLGDIPVGIEGTIDASGKADISITVTIGTPIPVQFSGTKKQ